MSRQFPRLSGRDLIRLLERAGFEVRRIRGSHHFLVHREDSTRWATVPVHGGRTLPQATLRAILRSSKLTPNKLGTFVVSAPNLKADLATVGPKVRAAKALT